MMAANFKKILCAIPGTLQEKYNDADNNSRFCHIFSCIEILKSPGFLNDKRKKLNKYD